MGKENMNNKIRNEKEITTNTKEIIKDYFETYIQINLKI
jgi:hypothetical protein